MIVLMVRLKTVNAQHAYMYTHMADYHVRRALEEVKGFFLLKGAWREHGGQASGGRLRQCVSLTFGKTLETVLQDMLPRSDGDPIALLT